MVTKKLCIRKLSAASNSKSPYSNWLNIGKFITSCGRKHRVRAGFRWQACPVSASLRLSYSALPGDFGPQASWLPSSRHHVPTRPHPQWKKRTCPSLCLFREVRKASLLVIIHFPSFPKSFSANGNLRSSWATFGWNRFGEPTPSTKSHFSYFPSSWRSFMDPGEPIFYLESLRALTDPFFLFIC